MNFKSSYRVLRLYSNFSNFYKAFQKVLTGLVAGSEVPGMWTVAFSPLVRQHSFIEIGQEKISMAILFILLIQVGHLSDTGERM